MYPARVGLSQNLLKDIDWLKLPFEQEIAQFELQVLIHLAIGMLAH
jgi:hypothetical protein